MRGRGGTSAGRGRGPVVADAPEGKGNRKRKGDDERTAMARLTAAATMHAQSEQSSLYQHLSRPSAHYPGGSTATRGRQSCSLALTRSNHTSSPHLTPTALSYTSPVAAVSAQRGQAPVHHAALGAAAAGANSDAVAVGGQAPVHHAALGAAAAGANSDAVAEASYPPYEHILTCVKPSGVSSWIWEHFRSPANSSLSYVLPNSCL